MGELIDGAWHRTGIEVAIKDGALQRPPSVFRNWIETNPDGRFQPEVDRYHLYVSLACPWAHRTLIMRALKGLDDIIGVSVVHWTMLDEGWTFEPGPGVIPDQINGTTKLYQIYTLADPNCTSRATVPVLWDKRNQTIVSNESADIMRMLNSAFDNVGAASEDYYPEAIRPTIDEVNERIYGSLNNGVYRAGFATSQQAYKAAVDEVFDTLDWLEQRLNHTRFICGGKLTEADIRLFTTLIRFDSAYHGHFKCNKSSLSSYSALWDYTRYIYQQPKIRKTVDFYHIKNHYYTSHLWLNPNGIVPAGPLLDLEAPTTRSTFSNNQFA